ncbi:MAG: response regulator transcription factor [Anaerolineales bacterium]|jgi:DNA-binding response OmpR family regulator
MSHANLLLIDDDALLRRSLGYTLEQSGFSVFTAETAEDGLAAARRDHPDLVLLDISLPGMDGLDALKQFKDELGIPVIFLTARRKELDEALGLELGADDYVTKPFDEDVLMARIKAVLRRMQQGATPLPAEKELQVGDLLIDPAAHTVHLAEVEVDLPPREFDLLHTLALEAGKVVSADDLLTRVWGAEYMGEPQVVYVHIRWLREKIEADPQNPIRIQTVRGVGYKLNPQGEPEN